MKEEKIIKLLESVGDLTINIIDFFEAFLKAGYGASPRKIESEFLKIKRGALQKEISGQTKHNYSNFIYRLKKDGLLKETKKANKKFFALTDKGKNKLSLLKNKLDKKLPHAIYLKETTNQYTIIAFDIPEKQRRKRDWLRTVLTNLGFKMIQKSVWVGKIKIPKKFIDDLFFLKLADFVEIFEISKTGTLKHLI